MKSIFNRWRESLIIIKPATVIKWHRKGFKLYLKWKCRNNGGRPKIPQEQINLIKRMAKENSLWGVPHIHGEMIKLGFEISEPTVMRYIVFNENHLRKLLKEYFHYYNYQRIHLGLKKDSPESRPVQVIGKIGKIPVANGLHSYYFRNAA